jgi:hypothetical protein
MSAKTVLAAVLVGAWLNGALAHSQEPQLPNPRTPTGNAIAAQPTDYFVPAGPSAQFGPPGPVTAPGGVPGPESVTAGPPGYACGGVLPTNTGLSDWILYRRDNGCECSPGGPPMMVEIFLRSGVSTPVGGTLLGRELDAGWNIQVGGRSLWFDPTWKKAWTLEANLGNTYNGAQGNQQVPLNVFVTDITVGSTSPTAKFIHFGQGGVPGVTIRGLNRSAVGLGFGREWYIWGSAIDPGPRWRIGWDGGGRYGSMKMDFNEIKHRTRVFEQGYAAAHSDFEWNCCKCIYYAGFRMEWDYTANTILQRQSDFQDINWHITLGVRW